MIDVLAVCRDKAALHSVLSNRKLDPSNLIIVSDDPGVHNISRQQTNLKVVFLSRMEPFFDMVPHVLQVLDNVNSWFHNVCDKNDLPTELIYWIQHAEGGDTTQRIQNAILLARSYAALLDDFQPLRVYIGIGSRTYWEDDVLIAIAQRRKISVQKLGCFSIRRILFGTWQRLRPIAKETYRFMMTVDSMIRRKESGVGSERFGRYVAIQLCSSLPKHLTHTLPLLKAMERQGISAIAITWAVGRTARLLRKRGYKVVELEAWVPLQVLFRAWWLSYRCLRYAKKNLNDFLTSDGSDDYAPLIRSALLPSVKSFIISGIPYRIRLDAACQALFSKNPPIAARLWTRILEEGVIAYRSMARIGIRPLLFWQPGWPYQFYWPYLRYDVPADLIFCLSNAHKESLMMDSGQPAGHYVVSGVQWMKRVKEFSSRTTPDQSHSSLGISPNAKLVIFCDAQVVLGGYFTAAEQFLLVKTVIEFAENHSDVCVLIKPHGSHKPGVLEAFFRGRGKDHVIWIPSEALPYDGLNAAHVVLTKFSTLVAEAMVLHVPSICVILDKEKRFAIYEDAVDYAFSIEELQDKLDALLDEQQYSSWADSLRKKQIDYIKRHFEEPKEDCYEIITQETRRMLNAMGET